MTEVERLRARCAELEKALRLFDNFAWTAVRTDCNEAMLELNRRITTARAVLAKGKLR